MEREMGSEGKWEMEGNGKGREMGTEGKWEGKRYGKKTGKGNGEKREM